MANNQRRISKLNSVMDSESNGGNGEPLSLGLVGMRKWYVAVDTSRGISPTDGESVLDSTWKMPLSRLALRNAAGIIPSEMLPSYVDDVIFGQFFDDTNGQYFVSLPDSASSSTETTSAPVVHYKSATFPGTSVTLNGKSYTEFSVTTAVSGKIYVDIYTYAETSGTVQYRFADTLFIPILGSYTYTPGNGVAIDPVTGGTYPIRARVASPITFNASGYIWHDYSGVTTSDSGVSAGLSAAAAPGFGDTVNLIGMHVDRYGHVGFLSDYTLTIPSAVATSSASGLMSSAYVSALGSAVQSIAGDYIISASKTGTSYALTHRSYGIGTSMYGNVSAAPAFGGTFNVPGFYADAYGHIRSISNYTVTIPSSTASRTASGLLSSSHYILLSSLSHATTSTDWLSGRTFAAGATSYTVPYLLPTSSYSVGTTGLLYDAEHGTLHIGENSADAASYSVMLGSYTGDHSLIRSYVIPDSGTTFLDLMVTDTNSDTDYKNGIRFLENGHGTVARQLLHSALLSDYYCALYVGGPDNACQSVLGLYNGTDCLVGFMPNWSMSSENSYFFELPAFAAPSSGMVMTSGSSRTGSIGKVLGMNWDIPVLASVQALTDSQKAQVRTNIGAEPVMQSMSTVPSAVIAATSSVATVDTGLTVSNAGYYWFSAVITVTPCTSTSTTATASPYAPRVDIFAMLNGSTSSMSKKLGSHTIDATTGIGEQYSVSGMFHKENTETYSVKFGIDPTSNISSSPLCIGVTVCDVLMLA